MKTMKIYGTEIVAKCYNRREEKLIRIINREIEHMVETVCYRWLVEQLDGEFSALFYLGVLSEPVSATLSLNELYIGSKSCVTVLTVKVKEA